MSATQTCELCGHTGDDVRVQLAWYRAELARRIGIPEVQTAARCLDHEGCRRRVIEGGDEWPLVLGVDAKPIALPAVEPPAPEPEPQPERQPQSDPELEEATAWFE